MKEVTFRAIAATATVDDLLPRVIHRLSQMNASALAAALERLDGLEGEPIDVPPIAAKATPHSMRADAPALACLSVREREVFDLIAQGAPRDDFAFVEEPGAGDRPHDGV